MKRTMAVIVTVVIALAGSVFAIRHAFFDRELVATGYLQPTATAELNFAGSAPVVELLVTEGERVSKGQVLARQDTSALEAQLGAREAMLVAHRLVLSEREDPVDALDVQALELASASAQAQLDAAREKAGGTVVVDDQVVAAAAVDVDAAHAALAADQAQATAMAPVCSAAIPAPVPAEVPIVPEAAATATTGVPITLPPPTAPPVDTSVLGMCNQLLRELTQGEARVAEAQSAYDVAVARRELNASTVGSAIDTAQQQLGLATTRAAIGTQPATAEDVAAAQNAVAEDTAAIARLEASVDAAVLLAPSDGVVGEIGGEVGEVAGPAGVRVFGGPEALPEKGSTGVNLFPSAPRQPTQPSRRNVALITLNSDTVSALVQVSESDIRDVRPGHRATVTLPALSESTLPARVERIDPHASTVTARCTSSSRCRSRANRGGRRPAPAAPRISRTSSGSPRTSGSDPTSSTRRLRRARINASRAFPASKERSKAVSWHMREPKIGAAAGIGVPGSRP